MNLFLDSLDGVSARYCLYRTAQHRKTRTHIHASSGIQTHAQEMALAILV